MLTSPNRISKEGIVHSSDSQRTGKFYNSLPGLTMFSLSVLLYWANNRGSKVARDSGLNICTGKKRLGWSTPTSMPDPSTEIATKVSAEMDPESR